MTLRALALSAAVCVVLVLGAAWLFRLDLEQAVVLAPVIVVSAAATVGIVVLWTKVAWDSLRRQRHPYRILAGALGALALLVLLSFFVELPSRGH